MGVIYESQWDEFWAPESRVCFYCHKEVRGAGVYWSGANGDIVLHDTCAENLAVHLIGDAKEIWLVSRPYLRRRVLGLVQEHLRISEGAHG